MELRIVAGLAILIAEHLRIDSLLCVHLTTHVHVVIARWYDLLAGFLRLDGIRLLAHEGCYIDVLRPCHLLHVICSGGHIVSHLHA